MSLRLSSFLTIILSGVFITPVQAFQITGVENRILITPPDQARSVQFQVQNGFIAPPPTPVTLSPGNDSEVSAPPSLTNDDEALSEQNVTPNPSPRNTVASRRGGGGGRNLAQWYLPQLYARLASPQVVTSPDNLAQSPRERLSNFSSAPKPPVAENLVFGQGLADQLPSVEIPVVAPVVQSSVSKVSTQTSDLPAKTLTSPKPVATPPVKVLDEIPKIIAKPTKTVLPKQPVLSKVSQPVLPVQRFEPHLDFSALQSEFARRQDTKVAVQDLPAESLLVLEPPNPTSSFSVTTAPNYASNRVFVNPQVTPFPFSPEIKPRTAVAMVEDSRGVWWNLFTNLFSFLP